MLHNTHRQTGKKLTIDRLAASTIALCEVTALENISTPTVIIQQCLGSTVQTTLKTMSLSYVVNHKQLHSNFTVHQIRKHNPDLAHEVRDDTCKQGIPISVLAQ